MSEKESYKNLDYITEENDEIEIDWAGYLRKLIAARKTLLWSVLVGAVLGVIIAFSIPKEYTVNVTLSPEMGDQTKVSGGLASLASSFLGSSASSNGSDAMNITLASDIVASTPFALSLFDMPVQTLDGNIDTTFMAYLDEMKSPWWSSVMEFPGKAIGWAKSLFTKEKEVVSSGIGAQGPIQLSEDDFQKLSLVRDVIMANVDEKTAITTVSVTLQDPKVAAVIADSVVRKLQEYIINYRIAKAKDDCAYLQQLFQERQAEYYAAQKKYAEYLDANKNLVLQSVRAEQDRLQNDMNLAYQVYSQVANQLQVARAKVQEAKPVFAVLEPATVPLQPSGTSRKMMIIAVTFVSFVITMGWILLGKEYWEKFLSYIKEK